MDDRNDHQRQHPAANQQSDDQPAGVGAVREVAAYRCACGNAGEGSADDRGGRFQGQADVGGQQADRQYLQHEHGPSGEEDEG